MSLGRTAAVALVATAVGCSRGADRSPPGDSAAPVGAAVASRDSAAAAAAPLPAMSEEDVQAVIDAVNGADARLAGAAAGKATDPDVRAFAGRLGSAHRQKVTDRPPPAHGAAGTAVAAPLADSLAATVARLAATPAGPAFDRAFVQAQVDAHARAMALLDRVAGAAHGGDLPALVAGTRAEVRAHLDEARALQGRLP